MNPPPPPPPIIPVVVGREAEASEQTTTAAPVAEATEPVVVEEVTEMVDPVKLLEQTVVPNETCPAPVVYTVHPEQVTSRTRTPMFWKR